MFSDSLWSYNHFSTYIPQKTGTNWKRFWVQHAQFKWFFLKLKSIIMFLTQNLFFKFLLVIFTMLFRRCPTSCKSTLKMKTFFRRCLTLFKSTLKQRWNVCWVTITYSSVSGTFSIWLPNQIKTQSKNLYDPCWRKILAEKDVKEKILSRLFSCHCWSV